MDTARFNNKGRFGEITIEYKLISEEKSASASVEDIESHLNAVKGNNDEITPNNDYEEAQKTINDIILNTIVKDRLVFTDSEWNIILELANTCPYINGPAVFEARALANSIDEELIFDDDGICSEANLRKRNLNNISKENFASIYPNPAENRLNVKVAISEKDKGEFRIYNLLGLIVFSKTINSKNDLSDIDIRTLSDGIYTCRLIIDSSDYLIGKLSVVH